MADGARQVGMPVRGARGPRRWTVPLVVVAVAATSAGFVGLAPAGATTPARALDAAARPGTAAFDPGGTARLVPAATSVVRKVAKRRCSTFRYYPSTHRTVCLRWTAVTVTARFTGAVVQQRDRSGHWVRVPYVWNPRARALVYSHWLALQLRAATPAPTPSAPGPGPTTSSPTTTASSPPASPTTTTSSPPATTTSTSPPTTITPGGTPGSPTPTSTSLAGEDAAHATSYAYLAHSDASTQDPATAAHWDRCTLIRWTVDFTRIASAGSTKPVELARFTDVMSQLSAVTGYTFVYVDTGTGQVPIDQSTQQPADSSYAATGADIVITYASDADPGAYRSTAMAGSTVGLGGPWYYPYASAWVAFRGDVQLDYTFVATAGEAQRTELYLHEIGHVMGLGHVGGDSTQVMYPMVISADAYRLGDRTGLWRLGREPCVNP